MVYEIHGNMNCTRYTEKSFTWWFVSSMSRQPMSHNIFPVNDIPQPIFHFEGYDTRGVAIIQGECPVCGMTHRLSDTDVARIAEEFPLS